MGLQLSPTTALAPLGALGSGGGGPGNVTGPPTSVDNEIARFSGITGKIIKDAGNILLSSSGVFTTVTGNITFSPTGLFDLNARVDQDLIFPNTLAGAISGYNGLFTINNSANSSASIRGFDYQLNKIDGFDLTTLIGINAVIGTGGASGVTSNVFAGNYNVTNTGAGVLTNGTALNVQSSNVGGGIYVNFTGIDFAGSAATNTYAFDFANSFIIGNSVSIRENGSSQRYFPISEAATGLTFDASDLIFATTTSGNIRFNPANNSSILVGMTSSNIVGAFVAHIDNYQITNTANNAATHIGFRIEVQHVDAFNLTSPDEAILAGIFTANNAVGAGDVTRMVGLVAECFVEDGAVTEAAALFVGNEVEGGTITNSMNIVLGHDETTGSIVNAIAFNFLNHTGTPTNTFFIKLETGSDWTDANNNFLVDFAGTTRYIPTMATSLGTDSIASYSFKSPSGSSGTFYAAGFYDVSVTDANLTNASTTVTHGSANIAYGAHAFVVSAGGAVTDGSDLVLTVTGTSITDAGVRTPGDSEIVVANALTATINMYFETIKKWIGQITYTLSSTGGTAFSFDFNYGLAKYDDYGNRDFTVLGFEHVGRAGGNDSGFNTELLLHDPNGWLYSAAGFIPGGTVLASMNSDYGVESNLANGMDFTYKRDNISQLINGSNSEGFIVRVTTGSNNSVESSDIHIITRL